MLALPKIPFRPIWWSVTESITKEVILKTSIHSMLRAFHKSLVAKYDINVPINKPWNEWSSDHIKKWQITNFGTVVVILLERESSVYTY